MDDTTSEGSHGPPGGTRNGLTCAAWLPDAAHAVTGCADHTLALWDTRTLARVRTYTGHSAPVSAVSVMPAGRRVLSGARDGAMLLWDVEREAPRGRFGVHRAEVTAIECAASRARAISVDAGGTMVVWDLGDRFFERELRVAGAGCVPREARIAPDGERAWLRTADGRVLRVSLPLCEPEALRVGTAAVVALALAPDGATLVLADEAGAITLALRDAGTGAPIGVLAGTCMDVRALAFAPDGRALVAGTAGGALWAWDLAASGGAPRELRAVQGAVAALAFAPVDVDVVGAGAGAGGRLLVASAGASPARVSL